MADPMTFGGPEGDENNDDTFGSSMNDVGTLVISDFMFVRGWKDVDEKLPARSFVL